MSSSEFNVGEKVFAKVRGYPPWPARVDQVLSKGTRYRVFFYGTYETGTVKSDEVFRYEENLGKYGNPRKLKGFNQALLEILENPDIGLQIDHSSDTDQPEESSTENVDALSDQKPNVPSNEESNQPSSSIPVKKDAEGTKDTTDKIPEGSAPQPEVPQPSTEKAKETPPKKKKAPVKASTKPVLLPEVKEAQPPVLSPPQSEEVPVPASPSVAELPNKENSHSSDKEKKETDKETPPTTSELTTEKPEPVATPAVNRPSELQSEPGERVSRSGRKIKPKRFADDGEDLPISPDRSHTRQIGPVDPESQTSVSKRRKVVQSKVAKEKEQSLGDKPSNDAKENQPNEESGERGGAEALRPEGSTPKVAKKSAKTKETKTPQSVKKSKAKDKVEVEGDTANPAKKVKLKEESLVENEESKNQKEKVKLQWDPASAKALLNEGDDSMNESVLAVKGQVETKVKYARMDKKKHLLIEKKKTEYKWLRVEGRLLQLDIKLKEALVVDHPHCEAAIEYLDEMYNLSVASLMLKKYPCIMDTIRKLKRYVGPKFAGELTDDQKTVRKHAETIRQKAEMVFQKFSLLFTTFDGQTFWDSFATHVENFKRATKHMSQEELLRLVREPSLNSGVLEDGEEKEPEAGSSSQRR